MATTTTRLGIPWPNNPATDAYVPHTDIGNVALALDNAAMYEQGAIGSIPAGTAKPNGYWYADTATGGRVWVNVGTGGSRAYRSLATGAEVDTLGAKAASDVQVFTASGTWTKPTGATRVEVVIIGGGGSGGSGRRGAAGTLRGAGGGGAGGSYAKVTLPASQVSATETVTVGAGGSLTAGITVNSTDGNLGSGGSPSTFGTRVQAPGGGGGGFGSSVAGGAGGALELAGGNGGTGGAGGGTASGQDGNHGSGGAPGGGGGNGLTTSDTSPGAGNGVRSMLDPGSPAGPGVAGDSTPGNRWMPGGGGGGGASPAGSGGAGGTYGAGGGGGAASLNGTTSGAGGAGAPGLVVVVSYFN